MDQVHSCYFCVMDVSVCLQEGLSGLRIPELIAVITGVCSVWFARKESILVYPVGLISVLLYVYICFSVKLYADGVIQIYYAIMSVYGWYYWIKGGKSKSIKAKTEQQAPIISLSVGGQLLALGITILSGLLFWVILDRYTDSTIPFWDGLSTAIFFTAMFLMARKYIENWLYWIVGDIICIPLFFSKSLCLSSLQYIIFTMLAIAGWMAWRKKLRTERYA